MIEKQTDYIIEKHEDFLESNFSDNRKFKQFLSELRRTPEDKMLPQELEFHNDCKKITEYYVDLSVLAKKYKIELDLEFKKISMPIFVERHPLLKAKWEEIHKDIVENMLELEDV